MNQLELVADANTRPANTTAYAAGDVAGYLVDITGASNATPIVITAASHGLTTGDHVTIASVGGNTAANGVFKVTVLTSGTFSLDGSTGNAAYTSGGTISRPYQFSGVANSVVGKGVVRQVRLEIESATTTNADFKLLLFRGAANTYLPLDIQADNVAFDWAFTDLPDYLGQFTFANASAVVTDGFATWQLDDKFLPYELNSGGTKIFGVLLATAAYAPESAKKFRVSLVVDKQ